MSGAGSYAAGGGLLAWLARVTPALLGKGWIATLSRRHPAPRELDRALIAAHGKAMALLLAALQSRGVIDTMDFGWKLGLFSVVVAEQDKLQADILAIWAGILKDAAVQPTPMPEPCDGAH